MFGKTEASRNGPRCPRPDRRRSGRGRRARRMGGENHFAGNPRHGLIEADAFVIHALSNGFEDGKSAVSFVQVQNPRGDAKRSQCAQTADAEQQFLVHAHARRLHTNAKSSRGPREYCLPRRNRAEANRTGPLSRARLWHRSHRGGYRPAPPRVGRWCRWPSPWPVIDIGLEYSSCCQPSRSRRWRKYP